MFEEDENSTSFEDSADSPKCFDYARNRIHGEGAYDSIYG